MKRRFPIYAIVAMIVAAFSTACNDDDDDLSRMLDTSADAVMVNTFSLEANDSVLANLDSVFFSIDLDKAVVFNADSLPRGTKVDALVTSMTFSSVRKAEITMPGSKGADTVVNYLSNPKEALNFSRGYVTLHLEAASGEVTRDYKIYVNVHKVDPDELVWNRFAAKLPTTLTAPVQQHTVELSGNILCFTIQNDECCRAVTSDPAAQWTKEEVEMPADVRLETLTAGSDRLFVLDASDNLYASDDQGATWAATGSLMSHIYGVLSDVVVGVKANGTSFEHVTYPASAVAPVAAGCPVSGTSPAIVYTTEWSEQPMMIVAGGKTSSGDLTGSLWAYDGKSWAELSSAMPGVEAPVLVPYYAFRTSDSWKVTRRSILLCFGGNLVSQSPNKNVYISYDMGVNWAKASEQMQLPSTYTPGAYAQAIVYNQTIGSRAVKPITEWDCPYIYMFGGVSSAGTLNADIWRGVINRLEFKPLQ